MDKNVDHEQKILKNQLQTIPPNETVDPVSFLQMFRFAKKSDYLYMLLGSICSALMGAVLPVFSYLWGSMANSFSDSDKMVNDALMIFIEYLAFGVGAIFAGWGMQYFWLVAGESQANECRKEFIASLMRQQAGWFDVQQSSQIISKFVADSLSLQMAVGEKVSLLIYLISMLTSGIIFSFILGWEMTLVLIAFIPVLAFAWNLMIIYFQRRASFEEEIFQNASGIAQQALQSIKIVKQFNGQSHEEERFDTCVGELKHKSLCFDVKIALSQSFCLFAILIAFSVAYWYGSECVQGTSNCPQRQNNPYSGGVVLTIFFALFMPAINLNQLAPSLKIIAEGKVAAARIFSIIDRVPAIKSKQNPVKLQQFKGVFRFEGVTFAYPKDKTKNILQDLTLEINSKRSGVMGESGCGKSTILQLMMRFYDPDAGRITLDGVDIRQLDLQWLRQQIGYVGQEPLLFSATIKENLLVGKSDATLQEMAVALRSAQILDFVMSLSENLETYVGSGGSQLSGGQKQRIAIARALIKNPQILLLDEATSALDRNNQKMIQNTLNKITSEMTSITVAHRLKTLLTCEQVFIFEKGGLLEQGKLEQLQLYQKYNNEIENDLIANEPENVVDSSPSKAVLQKLANFSLNSHTKLQGNNQLISSETKLIDSSPPEIQSDEAASNTYARIFSYISRNKLMIPIGIVGMLGSLVHGMVFPSMGIHIARILSFNLLYISDPAYYSSQIKQECIYMIITCIVGPISVALQNFTFHHIGNNVVNDIRKDAFHKVLRLPLSWFQDAENHAQQISIKLGADIYTINNIISRFVPHLCAAFSSVVLGLMLAFYFEWRTALVSIGLIPLIGISGMFQVALISGYLNESLKLYQQAAKMLTETLLNFKTILTFCNEEQIISKYSKKLDEIQEKQFRKKLISGIFYGLSYFILFVTYGLIFYLSAIFIRDNNLEITNSFSAAFLVLFSGFIAGINVKNMPDLGILKITANKLFKLIDLQDEDQIQVRKSSMRINKEIKGNIRFQDVCFKYDKRKQVALKNVSFEVKEGEKIGLVGPSGCGKSTLIKLLLGFYNCQSGQIIIDDVHIGDYDIHCLRRHFGTISQQPELFDETIEYNITYNESGYSKKQIYQAAEQSRLHLFQGTDKASSEVEAFFNRSVGPRGSHLSGGQKQRVAIARVILRNPKILLLDEATSALDKQNEQKVQECLDVSMEGRTTLNVTHKLQTLQNASRILTFKSGELIEEGTYKELLQKKGSFYRLLNGIGI